MYCSTCGNQIADHLNYCNSCGARIEKNPLIVSNSSAQPLARTLGVVGIAGFIGFIFVLRTLLNDGGRFLDQAAVVLILLGYLATLLLICAIMVGHMWKHSGDIRIKQHEPKIPNDYVSPVSFRSATTAQLEDAKEPGISVTEHTTRTLEEVPLNRN